MNIQEAKNQIRGAMTAYLSKDRYGHYRIPPEKQRPLFLYGASGIGKTAIVAQAAAEMGVGLVSYSMTHHTRQSALGLPYIVDEAYEGMHYRVTEYTMSEIFGSIYDMMRKTGVREGILFLDEINCVSETLAPTMLQFLQYKVFGQHHLPAGWIVVTAGNPPEYNKSVRDFDIATWDRLKRIDVEPDYQTWKSYAHSIGVHPAVLTYLDARQKDFYKIETSVDGKKFVTPRGWVDLSEMMKLYEEHDLKIDQALISQYLQDERIARDFAIYYDLFRKYRSDYQIDKILAGTAGDDIVFRAAHASMDERVSVLGLLFDALQTGIRGVCMEEDVLESLKPVLQNTLKELKETEAIGLLNQKIREQREAEEKGKESSSMSSRMLDVKEEMILTLEEICGTIQKEKRDP
ncbi:MAG: AAA family ATPase, partial [Bulleidia sp.]